MSQIYLTTCVVRLLVAANQYICQEEGVNMLGTEKCLDLVNASLGDVLTPNELEQLRVYIRRNSDVLG